MGDIEKLKVCIDRDECIGDGICCDEAPGTFELDDDSIAVVLEGSGDSRDVILEAARSCPVDVIIVEDKETGKKLYPED